MRGFESCCPCFLMNINFINHKLRTNVKTSVKFLKLRTRTKRKNFFLTKILKTSALIVKKNYKKHNFFLLRSLIFHNFLFNNYYKKK
uniref:Uncharacterized protein n=1 Tax=Oxytricha trifallax TaxID=1172189 RepID=G9HRI0_9SPIT|nr:hypothetical protein [Oxytricha trifallax]